MTYYPLSGNVYTYPSYYPAFKRYLNSEHYEYKMKVEGKGSIKVQPDTAIVILGVSTEDKQLEKAQEENARKIAEVLKSLKDTGIPARDIQTQAYSIEPMYDYIEGKQVFRGYRVLHSLKVTAKEVSKIGRIIDEAVESGANIVNNISFTVSEASALYRKALKVAIDDAMEKAKTIGDKLMVITSKVPIQIIEEGSRYSTYGEPALLKAAEAATQIQTGEIEITARIEAVFTYTAH